MNELLFEEGKFEPRPGVYLHEQRWTPAEPFKGLVIIVHGLAEHCGRYAHVAEFLARNGYAVWAFDLYAHGQSQGERAYIEAFDNFLDDLQFFLQRAVQTAGDRDVFLLGHSLGSSIVIKYLIDRPLQGLRGAVLTGTFIMAGESVPPILEKVVNLLAMLAPRLPVIKLDGDTISRDPEIVTEYNTDPLNFRSKLAAHTGAEINQTLHYLQQNLNKITSPLLILQGGADRLVNPAGSKLLYEQAASKDKTLKVYEGLYHEILNEPEKDQVMADILAWMNERLSTTA
jgi:alpha-beta hydrolase superfamily lysophospholipase